MWDVLPKDSHLEDQIHLELETVKRYLGYKQAVVVLQGELEDNAVIHIDFDAEEVEANNAGLKKSLDALADFDGLSTSDSKLLTLSRLTLQLRAALYSEDWETLKDALVKLRRIGGAGDAGSVNTLFPAGGQEIETGQVIYDSHSVMREATDTLGLTAISFSPTEQLDCSSADPEAIAALVKKASFFERLTPDALRVIRTSKMIIEIRKACASGRWDAVAGVYERSVRINGAVVALGFCA